MSKVLSVCVPSYNMEKYLNRCIDSFLVPEVLDQLEIIIVNDGSTDGTLSIANEYKTKYPQSIVVIDKPNGHYGSCVNASLTVATGKYFRIVDADDWVDSDALPKFMGVLEKSDMDCICTKRTVHDFNDNTKRTDDFNTIPEEQLDLDKSEFPTQYLRMHNLTYSTDLLHRIKYKQTEGICYTDTEYAYYPLSCARNVLFVDVSLYQYFVGRGDQSMSPKVIQKNISHLVGVIKTIESEHQNESLFNKNEKLLFSTVIFRLLFLSVPIYLLYSKQDKEIDQTLRGSIENIDQLHLIPLSGIFENRYLGIPYVSLWYKDHVLSPFCLRASRFVNNLMH